MVDLYWSKDTNSSKPVIIFSHGLGSVRTEWKYLVEHLASHGYPVVALEQFGDTGLSKVQVPTLLLAASADKTTPALTEQVIGFDKLNQPKSLVGIVGATHLSVKDPSATLDQRGKIDTPISGGEIVGEQAVDIRNYVKTIVLASAAQLTPQSKDYEVFLTPDYAQFASTTAFPIRLITQIPPSAVTVHTPPYLWTKNQGFRAF